MEFSGIIRHPYFVTTLILSISLVVFLPTLFLAFYPTRLARMLIRCICPGRLRGLLLIFMECFQGYYKNGTTGTYDYRAASCLNFLIRLVCLGFHTHWLYSETSSQSEGSITRLAFLLAIISLFYALVRPCKKHYMNVIESLLYFTAAMLLITIINNNTTHYNIVMVIILLPNVVFVAAIMYKTLKVIGIVKKTENLFSKLKELHIFSRWNRKQTADDQTHRLTNPTDYKLNRYLYLDY